MSWLKRMARRLVLNNWWVVAILGFLAAAGLALVAGAWDHAIVLGAVAVLLLPISCLSPEEKNNWFTWEDRKLLAKRGPSAVGDLATVMTTSLNAQAREVAKDALLKLLPRLDAPTYRGIEPGDRQAARELLASTDNVALAVALLRAVERVSDVEALPAVRRLAESPATDPRVLEAARSCAAFLEEAARQKRDAETLLRPADGAPTDTLLRPAGGAPTEPAEQLLRPADAGADPASIPAAPGQSRPV